MISVCLATYNGERYIRRQIESILKQLSYDDEIIISDNGSIDNTINIIKSFEDSRIKLYSFIDHYSITNRYSKSHYLVTRNFENAIKKASGDYIFLSDQDDIWYENKIEKMLPSIINGDLVQSNYSIIDREDKVIIDRFQKENPISNKFILNIYKQPFHGCCMGFPRSLIEIALPFPENLVMHDNWLGCLAILSGYNVKYIWDPLIYYRRHDLNVSKNISSNPLWFKIKYRIIFLIQLLNRIYRKNKKICFQY